MTTLAFMAGPSARRGSGRAHRTKSTRTYTHSTLHSRLLYSILDSILLVYYAPSGCAYLNLPVPRSKVLLVYSVRHS
jgi:hypothetical protein